MADPGTINLLSPADDIIIIGNVLVFTFIVPTDTDYDKLVFRVELDTNTTIDPSHTDYKVNESRLSQGKWYVKNGVGVYVDMPSGGVDSTYYGNDAKIVLRQQEVLAYPDRKTAWYWRIGAADGMSTSHLFNQVIYGQARFGNA